VILSGGGAGGVATFLWADYIKEHFLSQNTEFWAIPDGGYLIDIMNVKTSKLLLRQEVMNLLNITNEFVALPNNKCTNIYYGESLWKCIFA